MSLAVRSVSELEARLAARDVEPAVWVATLDWCLTATSNGEEGNASAENLLAYIMSMEEARSCVQLPLNAVESRAVWVAQYMHRLHRASSTFWRSANAYATFHRNEAIEYLCNTSMGEL